MHTNKNKRMKDNTKKVGIYFCVLIVLFSMSASSAYALEICLREAVSLANGTVYLSDIISSEARHLIQEDIDKTFVCKAPSPGKERQLSRQFIAMRLKNSGFDMTQVSFGGAEHVRIERTADVFTLKTLEGYAKDYLREHCGVSSEQCVIVFENLREDIIIPTGELGVDLQQTSAGFQKGRFYFTLTLTVNGEEYLRKNISSRVQERKKIIVARRPLSLHEPIKQDACELVERIVDFSDIYFSSMEDLVGKRTNRKIKTGEMITTYLVEMRPLIFKGQTVRGCIQKGNMEVVLQLRALEDGVKGQRIGVYCDTMRKKLEGRVIDEHQVEVLL